MQYRSLGSRISEPVSALGFGCMRLPTLGDYSKIDEAEAERMLVYAIDHGVNYVDTAYPYHRGASEVFVGNVLAKGHRDKVLLATKLPVWDVKERDDMDRLLHEQLQKLQTETIDLYLFHSLSRKSWERLSPLDPLRWAEKKRDEGKIRYIGFSFHDEASAFKEIIDSYADWDFCQIQYNYMDEQVQAGTEGLHYAGSRGIGVVIMEPLLGGNLANPPEPVQKIWDGAPATRDAVDWAFQWLWTQPEVGTVLSGMSTMEQVEQDVEYASHSAVGLLQPEELGLFQAVKNMYEKLRPVPCTSCGYCMPCPNGVDIPRNFSIYNEASMYNQLEAGKQRYARLDEEKRASACVECGECLDKCPQSIEIIDRLKEVHEALGQPA